MRTVSLLRHAKSSWGDSKIDDIDRPLSARGLRDAPRMAAYIASVGLAPDLVLCSTARRTRETLALIQNALGGAAIRFENALYLAEPAALLALLRRLDPAIAHIMIIGHNPGLELLAQDLSTSGDPAARRAMAAKFPTAALAVIDLDTDSWSGAGACRGTLRHFMSPKRLPGPGPSDDDG